MPTSLIQFSAGQRSTSGAVSTERNEDGGTAFSLVAAASFLGAGLCGADDSGGGLTEGARGAGFGSGAVAEGLVDGVGGFRAGVSAKAGDTEKEKSKIISRMLKKIANYTRPPRAGPDRLFPIGTLRMVSRRVRSWGPFSAFCHQRYFSRSRYRVVKKSSDIT
jgi:hypothetical protein